MEELRATIDKRWVRAFLIGLAIFCVYLTGLINSALLPEYRFSKFPDVLYAFTANKASLVIFPTLYITVGLILGYYLQKLWNDRQRYDLLGRGFCYSKGDQTYGQSKLLRPWEYTDAAQIRKVEDCIGIVLGQLTDNGEECLDFNPYEGRINSHMLAIGRSGGGKTFTFVLSFVFQTVKRRHSLIITDPKGDLYMQCSGYLRDNGYVVRTLNLKNPAKSDGWDMLEALAGPRLEENVGIFAHTLAVNMSSSDGGEDIYVEAGEALIKALILKVMLDPKLSPEQRKITTAYDMLLVPDAAMMLDEVFSDENITEAEKPAQNSYHAFKSASERLFGNIITHVAIGMQLFQRKDIREMFTTPGIDMTLPGKQPCAYFVQFPDVHTTYKFLTALFFAMMFTYLTDYADLVDDVMTGKKMGKLLTPVDFLLDEFPSIGTLPDWDSKMAVMRSRRINIVMIIQDYPQLVKRYKDSWKTIVNNCGCILTLGINEPDDTATWISNRCGTVTVEVQSSSKHSVAGVKRDPMIQQMSEGLGKRPLFNVDEVCTVDRDGSIIIITDHNPIYVHKFPYLIFKDSAKLYDTKPSEIIDISNKEERRLYQEAETAYLDTYWATHEMYPKIDYSDMSNAMYTEEPKGPFGMAAEVVVDDVKSLFKLFKKKKYKKEKEQGKDVSRYGYIFESAEKEAFKTFFEEYKQTHAVSSNESAISISPEELLTIIEADAETQNAQTNLEDKIVDKVFNSSDSSENVISNKKEEENEMTIGKSPSSSPYFFNIDKEISSEMEAKAKVRKKSDEEKEQAKRDANVVKKQKTNRQDISTMKISGGSGSGLPQAFKRSSTSKSE